MLDVQQIPPEIFGRIFELGTLNFGIGYLPPLCLVCTIWNDVVLTTPRLWGILAIGRTRSAVTLNSQISKAKAAPLTIIASQGYKTKSLKRTVNSVVELSHNWVNTDVPLTLLARCRWSDIRGKLEVLVLSASTPLDDSAADTFFNVNDPPLRLHTFIANGISKTWITRFLSPSITHFELASRMSTPSPIHHTLECIFRASQASFIKLSNIRHSDQTLPGNHQTILFPKLKTLEISHVLHASPMLCRMVAPALQTLSIRHTPTYLTRLNGFAYTGVRGLPHEPTPLRSYMSQWSQGDAIPTMLHTLELVSCLATEDVAFLIRWLARFPSLVRLILDDDAIVIAAELPPSAEETNLLKALASPQGAGDVIGGWLCPSLMELHLGAGSEVADLLPVAHARGRIASNISPASQPSRLRKIDATLCSYGTQEEIDILKSLVDNVVCECLGCSFKFMCM